MAEEKERKYLLRSDEWRTKPQTSEHYRQGYVCLDPDRSVRIRISDSEAFVTIKGKMDGGSRPEFEYAIPVDDGREMLERLCMKPFIEKTRHKIRENEATWEVDEFEGENAGLVVAELESKPGVDDAKLPTWVGEEVTDDPRYLNLNLVQHPYSEWSGRPQPPETKFQFKSGEKAGEGIARILGEELQAAIWYLSHTEESLDESVHETRKSIKRVRSVLRLIRPVLGKTYRSQNEALRDIGRALSPVRDGQAQVEMFDQLHQKYRESLGDRSLMAVRDGLTARRTKLVNEFRESGTTAAQIDALHEIANKLDEAHVDDTTLPVVLKGFNRTLQRGRNAFTKAYADSAPENFHEFRKRAKDLRYQVSLVRKAWPEVLEGYLETVEDLEQRLGDDHNLVVLRETVLAAPDEFGSQEDRDALMKLIDAYQAELRNEAKTIAERVYGEKSKRWVGRLAKAWKAWREEEQRDPESEPVLAPA